VHCMSLSLVRVAVPFHSLVLCFVFSRTSPPPLFFYYSRKVCCCISPLLFVIAGWGLGGGGSVASGVARDLHEPENGDLFRSRFEEVC
jgi:hypothetical protein